MKGYSTLASTAAMPPHLFLHEKDLNASRQATLDSPGCARVGRVPALVAKLLVCWAFTLGMHLASKFSLLLCKMGVVTFTFTG